MKYLHTMVRVTDLDASLKFYCDALGLRESMVESVLSRAIAMPASRFLRMKRSVSLLVSDRKVQGRGAIVEGTYQSPILVLWHRGARSARTLDVTLTRFV